MKWPKHLTLILVLIAVMTGLFLLVGYNENIEELPQYMINLIMSGG